MSNDTHNTDFLDLKEDRISDVVLINGSIVLFIRLKPNCLLGMRFLDSRVIISLVLTIFSINLPTQLVRVIGL